MKTDIWIERVGNRTWAISTERRDAYLYVADHPYQLKEMYEKDWNCTVGKIYDITKAR